MQPFAGKKISRTIYRYQVQPLFESAGLTTDVVGKDYNSTHKHYSCKSQLLSERLGPVYFKI